MKTIFTARSLLMTFASAVLLASQAAAQPVARTLPAAPNVTATQTPIKSAFEGYKAFSDDKMTGWKAANDEVARIGGWREYARQAQEAETTPVNPPAPAVKPGAGQPKAKP